MNLLDRLSLLKGQRNPRASGIDGLARFINCIGIGWITVDETFSQFSGSLLGEIRSPNGHNGFDTIQQQLRNREVPHIVRSDRGNRRSALQRQVHANQISTQTRTTAVSLDFSFKPRDITSQIFAMSMSNLAATLDPFQAFLLANGRPVKPDAAHQREQVRVRMREVGSSFRDFDEQLKGKTKLELWPIANRISESHGITRPDRLCYRYRNALICWYAFYRNYWTMVDFQQPQPPTPPAPATESNEESASTDLHASDFSAPHSVHVIDPQATTLLRSAIDQAASDTDSTTDDQSDSDLGFGSEARFGFSGFLIGDKRSDFRFPDEPW
jgi:hypothetical protein